jgi:hypothetical protein
MTIKNGKEAFSDKDFDIICIEAVVLSPDWSSDIVWVTRSSYRTYHSLTKSPWCAVYCVVELGSTKCHDISSSQQRDQPLAESLIFWELLCLGIARRTTIHK